MQVWTSRASKLVLHFVSLHQTVYNESNVYLGDFPTGAAGRASWQSGKADRVPCMLPTLCKWRIVTHQLQWVTPPQRLQGRCRTEAAQWRTSACSIASLGGRPARKPCCGLCIQVLQQLAATHHALCNVITSAWLTQTQPRQMCLPATHLASSPIGKQR